MGGGPPPGGFKSTRGTDDPSRGPSASTRPYGNPRIKKPEDDPVIAMARERHRKDLQIQHQRTIMSGASGAVLHKILELKDLEHEIKALQDGVQEYQDQIDLMEDRKKDLGKIIKVEQAWCDNFNQLIGPFEAKYEESKAEVAVSYNHAKVKYKESLQKLIDDFGFHPVSAVSVPATLCGSPRPRARAYTACDRPIALVTIPITSARPAGLQAMVRRVLVVLGAAAEPFSPTSAMSTSSTHMRTRELRVRARGGRSTKELPALRGAGAYSYSCPRQRKRLAQYPLAFVLNARQGVGFFPALRAGKGHQGQLGWLV